MNDAHGRIQNLKTVIRELSGEIEVRIDQIIVAQGQIMELMRAVKSPDPIVDGPWIDNMEFCERITARGVGIFKAMIGWKIVPSGNPLITIRDVSKLHVSDLMRQRNCGCWTVERINNALSAYGLNLVGMKMGRIQLHVPIGIPADTQCGWKFGDQRT